MSDSNFSYLEKTLTFEDTKIWYNIMFHMFVQEYEKGAQPEEHERINKLILEKL